MPRAVTFALACFSFALPAAVCSAPPPQQSQSKSTPQGTVTKLANPLNDLLAEAQKAIDKEDFSAAIPPLQKVIEEKPDFAYAHFQLAYVYTALRKPAEARAEYQKTVELDPKMSEAWVNLGILQLSQNPSDAVAPLQKAVALLPNESRPRMLLGVAYERQGDLKNARDALEGASNLDPKDEETLVHLGYLYLKTGAPDKAETKFRDALAIKSDDRQAVSGLAQALDAQKKPEAAEVFQKYLNENPSDPAAQLRNARSLFDQEKYDDAIAALDKFDAGKPPSPESVRLRADILIAQKKWGPAVAILKQGIAQEPKNAGLHGGLGRLYLQTRDFPNAEHELKVAIQLDQGNATYWKDLASTCYFAGDYPQALAALDAVAKLEPPTPGAWFLRALCYDRLQQLQPALDAYQKFIATDDGKNPDQLWQAQERSKVLKRMLETKR